MTIVSGVRARTGLMLLGVCLSLLGVLLLPRGIEPAVASGGKTEIRTGAMIDEDYDPHAFYVRLNGGTWQPTYAGMPLEGRLMNFRAANAMFDDENRSDDDPEANTSEFISNFDDYRAHGILAVTVSLQGGSTGYERALVSAFNPDGSLKNAWMQRTARVIEAADQRGMAIILTYFYQRQDQVLEDEAAVRKGIVNATDWLIANNYRNVIIEIANEFLNAGFNHPIIRANTVDGGIGELVNLAKSRFNGKGWRLPVSSSPGGIQFRNGIAATADVSLVHGNMTKDWEGTVDTYEAMEFIYDNHAVPVVMNEDDNGTTPNTTTLVRDTHAMDDAIRAGGSWGMMWKPYNQLYPMQWALGDPTQITTEDGYFHAILDGYQDRVGTGGPDDPSDPTPTPSPTPSATSTATSTPVPPDSTPTETTSSAGFVGVEDGDVLSGRVYIEVVITTSVVVDKVVFVLRGPRSEIWIETNPPYYFKGDNNGNPGGWHTNAYPNGEYTLTASALDEQRQVITMAEVRFQLDNDD